MKKQYVTVRTWGTMETRKISKNQAILMMLLSGAWHEAPDANFEELCEIAKRNLNFRGLTGFDSRGVRYSWDNIEGNGCYQPDTVVKNVASIFATAFPEGLTGKLKRWGSYGLKHDLERVTARCGKGPYVSNGYGIIGFVHYLLNVLHVPETDLDKYIKQQTCDGSPVQLNLDFMLPHSYIRTLGAVPTDFRF